MFFSIFLGVFCFLLFFFFFFLVQTKFTRADADNDSQSVREEGKRVDVDAYLDLDPWR